MPIFAEENKHTHFELLLIHVMVLYYNVVKMYNTHNCVKFKKNFTRWLCTLKKGGKDQERYNQVPHLTQDTT